MKLSVRKFYVLFIMVVGLLGFVLVPTYAKFVDGFVTDEDMIGINLNFDVNITNIDEYEEIVIPAGQTMYFNVNVKNNIGNDAYYGIWYKSVGNFEYTDNKTVEIGRVKGTDVTTSGAIVNNENVTVSLGVVNSTNSSVAFYIGVNSSLISENDIEYVGGKKLIVGEVESLKDIVISSIVVDGVKQYNLPSTGIYNMTSSCSRGTVISWDNVTRSLVYNVGAKVKDKCSLTFTSSDKYPLLNTMKVGDYVAYVGIGGKVGNNEVNCQIGGDVTNKKNEAVNSCLGQNITDNDDSYGYGSSDSAFVSKGWRIAYIKDKKVMLVSGGVPEKFEYNFSDKNMTSYILNTNALKYCNSNFVDGDCTCLDEENDGYCDKTSSDVWAIDNTDFYYMTKAINGGIGKRLDESVSSLGDIGGYLNEILYCNINDSNTMIKDCGFGNSLIDVGSDYTFSISNSDRICEWKEFHKGRYRGIYCSDKLENNNVKIRPVVKLSSSVYVIGGTGTINDPYIIGN